MYETSAAFRIKVLESHEVASGCDLYPANGVPIFGLPVTGGEVRVDNTASERRTVDLDVASADLVPSDARDPLAPYGSEVRPWRGVRLDDGSLEIKPLGVFRITDADIRDDGVPGLSIKGSDRSRPVARNAFIDPWIIPANLNYVTAIGNMLADRLPGVDMTLAETAEVSPLLVFDIEDDPWSALQKMAAAFGHIVLFDADGNFVLRPQPDPSDDQPVAAFVEGAGSTLLSVDRSLSDEPGYNGVVMAAESTTLRQPIRAVVWDMDPDSPTYALGPYGKVPAFQTNQFITSQTGADAAARAWLIRNLGGTDTITLTAIPNPALDADDVVTARRLAAGVDQVGIVQALTMPLDVASSMSVTLRARQLLVDA
jgi:hypothetical protein